MNEPEPHKNPIKTDMKRPNITPGKWKAVNVNGTYVVRDVESRTISENPGVTYRDDANARAIASVPKLLEALEEITRLVETEPESLHDFLVQRYCQTPAAWAREALIEAGYTFD